MEDIGYPINLMLTNPELEAILQLLSVESVPLPDAIIESLYQKGFLEEVGENLRLHQSLVDCARMMYDAQLYIQVESPVLTQEKAGLVAYVHEKRHLFLLHGEEDDRVEIQLSRYGYTPSAAIVKLFSAIEVDRDECEECSFPHTDYPQELDDDFSKTTQLYRMTVNRFDTPDQQLVYAIFPRTGGGVWRIWHHPTQEGDVAQVPLEQALNQLAGNTESLFQIL
jgi:hypothetical protein